MKAPSRVKEPLDNFAIKWKGARDDAILQRRTKQCFIGQKVDVRDGRMMRDMSDGRVAGIRPSAAT